MKKGSKKDENNLGRSSSYLGMGIALGVAIGAALHHIGLGIALGVAFGISLDAANKRKQDKNDGPE